MKIKDGFMLSRVAGSYVVVPVGAVQADFTGMITLNPVGAFLWGKLEKETTRDELLKNVLSQYDTDEKTAAPDMALIRFKLCFAGTPCADSAAEP